LEKSKLRYVTALGGAMLCGLLTAQASATVLTFQITQNGFPPGHTEMATGFPDYGDRVTTTSVASGAFVYGYEEGNGFTPNVVVTYSDVTPNGVGNSFHSSLGGWSDSVDYLHYQDNEIFIITFTPDAGYGVNLESFILDLLDDGPAGGLDFNWVARRDHDAGAVISSGSLLDVTSANDPTASVNASHTGTVVLQMSFLNAGNGGIVAIDDVRFTQFAIPEPGSLALLAGGAAMMLRRRYV
jgi:hypothetical protein